MAIVRVIHADGGEGITDYPEASALVDKETRVLSIFRGDRVVAEFPPERYLSWEILTRLPPSVSKASKGLGE